MLNAGKSLEEVRLFLGHSSLEATRIYAKCDPDIVSDAIAVVDEGYLKAAVAKDEPEKTFVKDGQITRVENADYPNKFFGDSHICQKGMESCKQPYSKERLLRPLKRVGARGEGKWEQISWEQALDEIAEKMLAIREEHGPEAIAWWNFIAGYPPNTGLGPVLASRLMGLWGGTDPTQSYGLDNGPQYAGQYTFNAQLNYVAIDPRCFIDSDLIIVWGANCRTSN